MMNLRPVQLLPVPCVETIPLRQKLRQATWFRASGRAYRPISSAKFRHSIVRLRPMNSLGAIHDLVFSFDVHRCMPIWQPEENSRSPYRRKIPRIQREEIHPWLLTPVFVSISHIRSNVELRELRD